MHYKIWLLSTNYQGPVRTCWFYMMNRKNKIDDLNRNEILKFKWIFILMSEMSETSSHAQFQNVSIGI